MPTTREALLDALKTVPDPDLHQDIVSLGMVKQCDLAADGSVAVTVELTTPACPMKAKIKADVEAALRKAGADGLIEVNMTARVQAGAIGAGKAPIPGIRNIIAVGSGKGGVGKSTTAVNLALGLQLEGASVAILDADIYGPNVPGMLGLRADPPRVVNNRIQPAEAHGIRCMSMGLIVGEDQALIFRGPMLHGAIRQLINDVEWGEVDYLVIDLPPGTGDVQLTLCQTVPMTGAVIVTTPQRVALQDARRAVSMFQKFELPILGIVENMAYYVCGCCGNREEIFDSGGGQRASDLYDVPFLGQIPLVTSIRQGMDYGVPIVVGEPDSPHAKSYREFATKVAQQVSVLNARQTPAATS